MKAKYLIITLLSLEILSLTIFPGKLAKAQETTFPVNDAGIAAYVKLDADSEKMIEVMAEALNYFQTIEESTETYVIGTTEIENKIGQASWSNFPHLYIGLDGWMVAYYLKDEESSQIIQWKDYTPGSITTTTLKDAIDLMCQDIGVTYSGEVKYYDFEFPEADKMTIIAETIEPPDNSDSFSLVIPGTLYEASYSLFTGGKYRYYSFQSPVYSCSSFLRLFVDENKVFEKSHQYEECWESYYGYYDVNANLKVNVPHFVKLEREKPAGCEYGQQWTGEYVAGGATVLIYK